MLLNYVDQGPGPVVVLLHGFPLDHSMWDAQITTLGATYRVIAPDLRGHGKSPTPKGRYTIDDMADDVIEQLDALGIREPVALGGLSMGGYVALSLAARYAGRLRGLMLMNTRATPDTPEAARGREETAQRVERESSAEPVAKAMLPKLVCDATRSKRADVVDRLNEIMTQASPHGVAAALRAMASRPDRSGDLAKIAMPTLVIAGRDDILIPLDESRKMAAAIPKAKLLEVAEAGHVAPMEQPAAVNQAILEFLDSVKATV
jgi:pimeloyl-ACP methyl ester carboxylesterase